LFSGRFFSKQVVQRRLFGGWLFSGGLFGGRLFQQQAVRRRLFGEQAFVLLGLQSG
jgi:hypothetical protein